MVHLLGSRGQLDAGDAVVWVVGHHDGVVPRGTGQCAAIPSLLLNKSPHSGSPGTIEKRQMSSATPFVAPGWPRELTLACT